MNIVDYLAIPYGDRGRSKKACDCFGLVHLFYKEEFGIKLPSYIELYKADDKQAICDAINNNRKLDGWVETEFPRYGDMVILNLLGRPLHTGVMLDEDSFIHCLKGKGVSIENVSDISWKNRINGFLRWQT